MERLSAERLYASRVGQAYAALDSYMALRFPIEYGEAAAVVYRCRLDT
jgi:hypothetical protein